jgi:hypothetical protein
MSIKSKVFAVAASLTMVGGLGAGALVTAGAANAASPSCGHNCIDIFSKDFGTFQHPAFVVDVYKQAQAIGQPVILFRTSNADPAEDFVASNEGTVADFFAAGLVSSAVALHYGCIPGVNFPVCGTLTSANLYAYEIEYAPFGAATGLCVGVGATAVQGSKVSLQPCGVSAKTIWIVDLFDSIAQTFFDHQVPLINGSDTNFSHPFVLTYPAGAFPTDKPRPQLYTSNLTGFSQGGIFHQGSISDTQLWSAVMGELD